MNVLSLFAGIGGIDLAAEWAGMKTVAFCEINPFCQKVLRKHWPDVPIFDDVKTLGKEALKNAGIYEIGALVGGSPCQPHCSANKTRKGIEDERYLWPEMLRIGKECNVPWIIHENVPSIAQTALDIILDDLEEAGYETITIEVPAYAFGAPHERWRTFTVAHSNGQPKSQKGATVSAIGAIRQARENACRGRRREIPAFDRDVFIPRVVGRNDGLPNRLDRCKALGNAVSPHQIYPIFKAIMDVEKMR